MERGWRRIGKKEKPSSFNMSLKREVNTLFLTFHRFLMDLSLSSDMAVPCREVKRCSCMEGMVLLVVVVGGGGMGMER